MTLPEHKSMDPLLALHAKWHDEPDPIRIFCALYDAWLRCGCEGGADLRPEEYALPLGCVTPGHMRAAVNDCIERAYRHGYRDGRNSAAYVQRRARAALALAEAALDGRFFVPHCPDFPVSHAIFMEAWKKYGVACGSLVDAAEAAQLDRVSAQGSSGASGQPTSPPRDDAVAAGRLGCNSPPWGQPPNWQMAAPPKPDLRETCRVAYDALVMASQFFHKRDEMNAAVHCGDTRWSPITQLVADARARVDTDMEGHGIQLGPRAPETP